MFDMYIYRILFSISQITATVSVLLVMLRDANQVKIESAKIPVILHSLRKARDEFALYKMAS